MELKPISDDITSLASRIISAGDYDEAQNDGRLIAIFCSIDDGNMIEIRTGGLKRQIKIKEDKLSEVRQELTRESIRIKADLEVQICILKNILDCYEEKENERQSI